jgi:ketosteroid isomerase-like protein
VNTLNKITPLKRRCALAAIGMLSVIATIAVQAGIAEPAAAGLEARLQKVEDILAIQQLLGDYMTAMDASDYAAYSELFAADGELIFQTFRLKGPRAIRELMEQGSRSAGAAKSGASTAGLRHMMSNIVIRLDAARATSTARWIVMSQGADSRPILGATGRYEDTLRKDGDQWKFQRRVIYTDFPYQNPLEEKQK